MGHTIINRPRTVGGRTFSYAPPWGTYDTKGRPLCPGCGRVRKFNRLYCWLCRRELDREAAERQRQAEEQRRRDHEAKMAAQRLRRALESGRYQRPTASAQSVGDLTPKPFTCGHCGTEFVPQRNTARYCSPGCRLVAWRARQ
jgi:hypothetical protein